MTKAEQEREFKVLEAELRLSVDQVRRIVSFLGYGNPSGSVWFIGFEEGLGGMTFQDTIDNVKARSQFQETMDLYEAHRTLKKGGRLMDIQREQPETHVWKWMAKILRARSGHKDWDAMPAANEYVRTRLGRRAGEAFMTELSPVPSAKVSDKKWMRLFKQLDPGIALELTKRRARLIELVEENRKALIICYGKRDREFAQLLGVNWRAASRGVCVSETSRHLLLPFFGMGHMNDAVIRDLISLRLLR
jgi:hypothetical protein